MSQLTPRPTTEQRWKQTVWRHVLPYYFVLRCAKFGSLGWTLPSWRSLWSREPSQTKRLFLHLKQKNFFTGETANSFSPDKPKILFFGDGSRMIGTNNFYAPLTRRKTILQAKYTQDSQTWRAVRDSHAEPQRLHKVCFYPCSAVCGARYQLCRCALCLCRKQKRTQLRTFTILRALYGPSRRDKIHSEMPNCHNVRRVIIF